ncbi:MAG: outer membrane lipoprotein carrier protein LolA [Desulfobacteraceae bacterium]|nr:outer membrane lipoprotein carrier protein LolA [Desulfobacteraceae bacterium]MBC2753966.1 outer membrane lipoprotein carrier protein LolA [Desulfobacteraceae bacterium]
MKNILFLVSFILCVSVMTGISTSEPIGTEAPSEASMKTSPETSPKAPPVTSSLNSHEEILEKLETRYNAADFSAAFSQESTLKALDITDTAAGKVWFKHPEMMRWEYERPEKYAIISDGKNLWIYRPEDNQVVIGNAMTYFGNGKGASFLSNFKLVQDAYTVSVAKPANDGQYTLKLVPKQKQIDLSAIFLNIEKKSFDIKSVLTLNDYGDETRIEFSDLIFEDLDASLFNFRIPPGADILKLDE